MLKETETEKTIVFFVKILSLVEFQLGGHGRLGPPLATPMQETRVHLYNSYASHRTLNLNGL